jgi:hypothetical protein
MSRPLAATSDATTIDRDLDFLSDSRDFNRDFCKRVKKNNKGEIRCENGIR